MNHVSAVLATGHRCAEYDSYTTHTVLPETLGDQQLYLLCRRSCWSSVGNDYINKSLFDHYWSSNSTNMTSPFERAVELLPTQSHGRSLARFVKHLDSAHDILSLRATSQTLRHVKEINNKAFKSIYIHAPCHGRQDYQAIQTLGPLCQSLVIKIAYPPARDNDRVHWRGVQHSRRTVLRDALQKRIRRIQEDHEHERAHPPASESILEPEHSTPVAWKLVCQRRPNQLDLAHLAHWQHILSLFPNIFALTIACNGEPGWPGCTDIEMCLINIRICIERANFTYLRAVTLNPIHAAGIMHFRWAGLGAYGEANGVGPPSPGQPIPVGVPWQRLERLELCLKNPFMEGKLSSQQKETFEKVLTDYLRSFKQTLRVLKLGWDDGFGGPNPLLFGTDATNEHSETQEWVRLEEVWLKNTLVNRNAVSAVRACAPVLQRLMVYTHFGAAEDRLGGGPAMDSGSVWRDVLHARRASLAASDMSAVSDSSRSIPIRLGAGLFTPSL